MTTSIQGESSSRCAQAGSKSKTTVTGYTKRNVMKKRILIGLGLLAIATTVACEINFNACDDCNDKQETSELSHISNPRDSPDALAWSSDSYEDNTGQCSSSGCHEAIPN